MHACAPLTHCTSSQPGSRVGALGVVLWLMLGSAATAATTGTPTPGPDPTITFTRTPTNVVPSRTPTPRPDPTITLTRTATPRPDLLAVTAILPPSGPAAGGTAVTIVGANFADGASALVGGQPATGVSVVDAGHISATLPALVAATLNDVTITNPNTDTATLRKGWLADFFDVPQSSPFHASVEKVFRAAVSSGCGAGLYCPGAPLTRAESAVLLLKAQIGAILVPPSCVGVFADVTCPGAYTDWIEYFYYYGYTAGCGGGNYCPNVSVSRAQLAVLLLKARHGSGYLPPACQGTFADVTCPGPFADWIEQLAAEGITAGCGGGNYCPSNPVTRGQMAVFLSKGFILPPLDHVSGIERETARRRATGRRRGGR